MITKLNMTRAKTKSQDWWLDSRATIHVCNDKSYFKTYIEIKEIEKVLIGNHVIAEVLRKGSMEIKFTSR